MEEYKVNHTYLVEYGNSLLSVTILKVSKEAYHLRWNNSNETTSTEWCLKPKFKTKHKLIEDVTEIVSTISTIEYDTCPTCSGMGSIPEVNTTAGISTCPTCWGNKFIAKKMTFKN